MPRYKLLLEYDGRAFCGWQAQRQGLSVQEVLEKASLAYAQEKTRIYGAGRTDSGVHAMGQVAHLDWTREKDPKEIQDAMNFHIKTLPLTILEVAKVSADFHARFSATARHYLYKIRNRAQRLTFEQGLFWHVRPPLDIKRMEDAAEHFVGTHDFTTFRSAHCQAATPKKTLSLLKVEKKGEVIEIRAEARSFLQHQVRGLVGALKYVGAGQWSPEDAKRALQAAERAQCPPQAPAHGLYLERVLYDDAKGKEGA